MGGPRVDHEARKRRVYEVVRAAGRTGVKQIVAVVREEWGAVQRLKPHTAAAAVYVALRALKHEGLVTCNGARTEWWPTGDLPRITPAAEVRRPGAAKGPAGVPYSPQATWTLEELLYWVDQVEGMVPLALTTARLARHAVLAAIDERDRLRKLTNLNPGQGG